ncbi:MAG TPA: PAS domain S-box protein [Vicinamibacteria bacterium]|nr:PAS domain S-box protein [Vicinamibacteria bacterium]
MANSKAKGPLQDEALRLSEERFRLLVESVHEYAIFMLDPQGYVISWNAGAERLKQYKADEIIGQHFSVFYPREALDQHWPEYELKTARADGRFEDEGWRLRKDGTRFWANVVITSLQDSSGQLIGFSKITRDLTDRRRQEEELRHSEERFRLMVSAVRDYAIFMLDPEGRVATWNEGAERIKGYRPSEIIGQHFSRFYPPDRIAARWPEHELAVASAEGRFEDEGWRIRKDGTRFWANVVITALHGPTGELRGFTKVTRDLTERRRVEALEEEGRQINEFLAMLGHELRNPLGPIRNAVAVMGAKEGTDPTTDWARQVIERQVRHLGRLVDDLLDVGRITSGKITLRREVVDFGTVVARALEAARPLHENRQQTVEADLGNAPFPVLGDATRLAQVVANLLSNAAKYTPEGGHVDVRLQREDREAVLRVRDDGVGMSAELIPKVFDIFVQGDRSLDRAEGGLGIGLTLVQRLVSLHGGRVSAQSPGPGQGSEFVVRLPIVDAGAVEPALARPAQGEKARRLRVLVVDDNKDAVESMALLLGIWGHEVTTASEGAEALDLAKRLRPDVVLLDIGLPGLNGYEVARRIRAQPGGVKTVLIAMTGYGQAEDRLRAQEAGFALHLVKPVEPEALQRALAKVEP